jgi:hypothetical protein
VLVVAPDGSRLARGLSAYASADAERIAGHRSDRIEAILGWRGRDEIIHRDDLVLLQPTARLPAAEPAHDEDRAPSAAASVQP